MVFENNDARLWSGLRLTADRVLRPIWEAGGLAGASANDAYYIRCDEFTNPPQVVQSGEVRMEGVFENNDERLWSGLRQTAERILRPLWEAGQEVQRHCSKRRIGMASKRMFLNQRALIVALACA